MRMFFLEKDRVNVQRALGRVAAMALRYCMRMRAFQGSGAEAESSTNTGAIAMVPAHLLGGHSGCPQGPAHPHGQALPGALFFLFFVSVVSFLRPPAADPMMRRKQVGMVQRKQVGTSRVGTGS